MWYAETANDLFKAGVRDDKFILIANSNKECQVAVKTPWGVVTDRIKLKECITETGKRLIEHRKQEGGYKLT